jgi:hypothetical protein
MKHYELEKQQRQRVRTHGFICTVFIAYTFEDAILLGNAYHFPTAAIGSCASTVQYSSAPSMQKKGVIHINFLRRRSESATGNEAAMGFGNTFSNSSMK